MIRVVVVDDSAFMRKALTTMLEKDPEIKVVATARNGADGLNVIRQYDPDVVTLDIEMPKMDGLTALRHIMMEMPRPVLMISSLTMEGAEATLKAMELGAVDFIPKQLANVSLEIVKIEKDLQQKVKHVSRRKIRAPRTSRPPVAARRAAPAAAPVMRGRPKRDVVAIGVSTGGPPAVQKVLSKLPANFPASILIAQHMPGAFTGPFAKRLDSVCKIKVKEASGTEALAPGTVYIAPGGKHIVLQQRGSRMEVAVKEEPADALYKPSANILIESVARTQGRRAVGAIFTGMGNDGLLGIRELKSRGGYILAQNDASCVVYGMPKAIVDAKLTDEIHDIDDMAAALMESIYK
ncbi:protein-glutamate methylesterase/protein-glutamine glutaminase [Halodesulfovibrio spirochaetisodalis]|uniref:Protein-glutamate methylesterase/protein-glutamine glutaminase n=1 Tax=Halodesulfovibrio spirochaetisodalis TaxID=1560234 RepID=A0A1B7X9Y1_9BACT|nr:chemotaxis response regulator protein-glutamate methylesterase [Halodesulfovibrio spirochaetisodalis]OBQ46199.1 chemotaxis protein CheY [Halodesulfovibrio spirochaetisodalis]